MNKFSAVPRRLPSITKHKVSMLRPVCREHQITFYQIAELGLIGTGERTVEDGLLINLAKIRAHVQLVKLRLGLHLFSNELEFQRLDREKK